MSNYFGYQIKPIPDETFFGLLVAAGVLAGCETYSQAYRRLLGNLRTCPASLLPRGLDKLSRYLPDRFQKDIEAVCYEHTSFPYFHHFAHQDALSRVKEAMLSSVSLNIHSAIGLTNAVIREGQQLKYCSACANEQWVLYDRATWLRSHQFPGVDVCHRHGQPLIESSISTVRHGTHSGRITLPPFSESAAIRDIWSIGDAWDKTSPTRLIAQLSHELLMRQSPLGTARARGKAYRAAFLSTGYGQKNAVDWGRVAGALREKYGDLIPRKLGIDFTPKSSTHWIYRITANQGGIQHPLQHILVIGAFFDSLDQLGAAISDESARLLEKETFFPDDSCQPTNPPEPIEFNSLDRKLELHRQTLVSTLSHNPQLSRSEIKIKIGHAKYKWMLINDRRWVESHLPAKRVGGAMKKKAPQKPLPRIEWAVLDKKTAIRISTILPNTIVRKLNNQHFINKAHLARLMGLSYTSMRRLISFPHTNEAVRMVLAKVAPYGPAKSGQA